MKNRLIPCVLACLMIFLVGCNGNTAKEAAQEITKTETSFPAGNTETDSQEETAEEPESTTVQEETPITAEESQSTAERQTVATVQTKPAEEKTADTPATEKPKAEPPKQTTTQAEPEKQTEQPKEQTTAEQKPVEKPTEKPAEPKPTEPHKQTFDVSPYVSYAKEYAVNLIKQGMYLFSLGEKIECLNKIYYPSVYKRFDALADFLGCSKKALAIRMKQLGLLKKEYLDNPFDLVTVYPEVSEL